MRKIVYYVTSSVDGFASDYINYFSRFAIEGNDTTPFLTDPAKFNNDIIKKAHANLDDHKYSRQKNQYTLT